MKNHFSQSRRNFLKTSLTLGALMTTNWFNPSIGESRCKLTPQESSGPFYPLNYPLNQDNDLTYLQERTQKAMGEVIYVKGLVQDEHCKPISKVLVEIWQACSTGRYNHPDDRNTAKLDPHFQYWGKAITNEKGEYGFKTIKPGSYPVSWFWTRPPHIHFTVRSPNHSDLITQMYFSGEPLNDKDKLLQKHSKEEQGKCIVTFHQKKRDLVGQFNLTLKRAILYLFNNLIFL